MSTLTSFAGESCAFLFDAPSDAAAWLSPLLLLLALAGVLVAAIMRLVCSVFLIARGDARHSALLTREDREAAAAAAVTPVDGSLSLSSSSVSSDDVTATASGSLCAAAPRATRPVYTGWLAVLPLALRRPPSLVVHTHVVVVALLLGTLTLGALALRTVVTGWQHVLAAYVGAAPRFLGDDAFLLLGFGAAAVLAGYLAVAFASVWTRPPASSSSLSPAMLETYFSSSSNNNNNSSSSSSSSSSNNSSSGGGGAGGGSGVHGSALRTAAALATTSTVAALCTTSLFASLGLAVSSSELLAATVFGGTAAGALVAGLRAPVSMRVNWPEHLESVPDAHAHTSPAVITPSYVLVVAGVPNFLCIYSTFALLAAFAPRDGALVDAAANAADARVFARLSQCWLVVGYALCVLAPLLLFVSSTVALYLLVQSMHYHRHAWTAQPAYAAASSAAWLLVFFVVGPLHSPSLLVQLTLAAALGVVVYGVGLIASVRLLMRLAEMHAI